MKNSVYLVLGLAAGVLLAAGLFSVGAGGQVMAEDGAALPAAPPTAEGLLFQMASADGSDESPPPAGSEGLAPMSPLALATPTPGETQLYFVPTDSDATATVLYLYNTDTVEHVVALRGYNHSGVLVYAQNINVPATSFRRLVSDSVVAAPPPSWATPAPITTNFTDFVSFASLSLPKGVKVEGYTLFNPGTGTVNPRADQGAVPLRFSTDPATVFLPLAQSN